MDKRKLEKMFQELGVDALISEAPQTRLWYSKVQTTDGYIVIEPNSATLFVDGRYIEYARANAKNVDVKLLTKNTISEFFEFKKFKKIALEKNYLTKAYEETILNLVKPEEVKWINGQELRIVKSEEEIETLQECINISLKSYDQFMKWLKSQLSRNREITEKHAAAKLTYLLQVNGCEKDSFDAIIATGKNSAEPHHHPTNDVIQSNNVLKVDFGGQYKGFAADITRTSILGDSEKVKDSRILEIYEIVKEAARRGRDFVKPGIKAKEVDKVCRDYINAAGYGKYFVHSTGHGLGIDVHELPNVSTISDYVLEPGMVITVEPGIYIEGLGGVRIEDDVLVTSEGHRVLTRK